MRRNLDLTFHAAEHLFDQFVFELLDLLTERRLRDVALIVSAGKTFRSRPHHHVTKLLHFHEQYLS